MERSRHRVMPIQSLQTVDGGDLQPGGRQLDAIFEGTSSGVCIRGFLSPAEVAAWLASIEAGELPEPQARFDEGGVRIALHGPLLEQSADVGVYCDRAEQWRTSRLGVPPGLQPAALERRVQECMTAMSSAPVECLRLGGRLASHGSLRWLGEGGFIGAHFELAMLRTPYVERTAVPLIDTQTVLSFLLPLTVPGTGGRLELFDVRSADMEEGIVYDRYAMARVDVDALDRHPVPLGPGDLCIFDSGRIFHHVSRAAAPPWRWTFGGFAARSRGGDRVYYWG